MNTCGVPVEAEVAFDASGASSVEAAIHLQADGFAQFDAIPAAVGAEAVHGFPAGGGDVRHGGCGRDDECKTDPFHSDSVAQNLPLTKLFASAT